jgi:hypothetical protein
MAETAPGVLHRDTKQSRNPSPSGQTRSGVSVEAKIRSDGEDAKRLRLDRGSMISHCDRPENA